MCGEGLKMKQRKSQEGWLAPAVGLHREQARSFISSMIAPCSFDPLFLTFPRLSECCTRARYAPRQRQTGAHSESYRRSRQVAGPDRD